MIRVAALALSTCLAVPALADERDCSDTYVPASPDFDFTDKVDRWGQARRDYSLSSTALVGSIHINRMPIFNLNNDDENNALFRFANRVHTNTRASVIRNLLLFDESDEIDVQKLEESERLLRRQPYLGGAAIQVVGHCYNTADVEVITREAWTLVPELKLKTSGGETETGFGISDSNFLGSGSGVTVNFAKEAERDRFLLHYDDYNLRGSRINLTVHFEENSDGFVREFGAALPFYELDAQRTWGARVMQSSQVDHQYELGDAVSGVDVARERLDAWWGTSQGLVAGSASRYTFGVAVDQARFRPSPSHPTPVTLPADYQLIYPYVEFGRVENDFGVGFNINQIGKAEDFERGTNGRARFGFSPTSQPRLVFEGDLSDTMISREKQLLQAEVSWAGRYNFDDGAIEDSRLDLTVDFHRGQTENRNLYLGFSAIKTWNLSAEKQIVLGGSNGLRGYAKNFSTGDASIFVTAEQRLFTNRTLFSLFNLGYVAFVDAGTTSTLDGIDNPGFLADVGVGIRLVPNKTDRDHVIHFDVAWPLTNTGEKRGPHFLVEVTNSL